MLSLGEQDTTKFGVSRRTLAKGAAWSVPAVAVAAAAPAYAQSYCVTVDYAPNACKFPGQSTDYPFGYQLALEFTNSCGGTRGCFDVTVKSVTKTNGNPKTLYTETGAAYTPPTGAVEVCIGQPYTLDIGTVYSSNSSNGITVVYEIGGVEYTANLDSPPNCDSTATATPSPAAQPEATQTDTATTVERQAEPAGEKGLESTQPAEATDVGTDAAEADAADAGAVETGEPSGEGEN